eukprot:jgi/Chlat1/6622/Chrsp482S06109
MQVGVAGGGGVVGVGSGGLRVLAVVKRSLWDLYTSFGESARVPGDLGTYLRSRHDAHGAAVHHLRQVLRRLRQEGAVAAYRLVTRSRLAPELYRGVGLVVSVGGDGTVLSAAHGVSDPSTAVFGINSDPAKTDDGDNAAAAHKEEAWFDTRRSTGWLCACTADSMEASLSKALEGWSSWKPAAVSRIRVSVRRDGAEANKFMPIHPLALNDVLLAHPSPASTSRFRLSMGASSLHVRSSGLRVSTAAGSTAAMHAAGGVPMQLESTALQYMVREPIVDSAVYSKVPMSMHSMVGPESALDVRWGTRQGCLYIDGAHERHSLQLGDEIRIARDASPLLLYRPPPVLV